MESIKVIGFSLFQNEIEETFFGPFSSNKAYFEINCFNIAANNIAIPIASKLLQENDLGSKAVNLLSINACLDGSLALCTQYCSKGKERPLIVHIALIGIGQSQDPKRKGIPQNEIVGIEKKNLSPFGLKVEEIDKICEFITKSTDGIISIEPLPGYNKKNLLFCSTYDFNKIFDFIN